jgi:hypothetical protein
MKRNLIAASYLFTAALSVSCSPSSYVTKFDDFSAVKADARKRIAEPPPFSDAFGSPTVTADTKSASQISFDDQTNEVVGRARQLIEKNEREGAVLDQRWYGFRRFGKHQGLILGATNVIFCGGLEADVRSHFRNQYETIEGIEDNQDPGEIRLYAGRRSDGSWDFIIIGQNGKEVALKTVIRLLYMSKFLDNQTKQKYREQLQSFHRSLKVVMSSVTARHEFISFFQRHGIREPDAVLIGFMSDSAFLLRQAGISNSASYSDESLRVSWYPNANGKKVLLVSINGNRIYGSRAGQLIEAIFETSPHRPPFISFLGSAGTIEAPELVWKIVTPVNVQKGDPAFTQAQTRGELVQLIRNRAVDAGSIQTAHASVETVVVETTNWVKDMKRRGIKTVDQELLHVAGAINSSPYGTNVQLFVGILVTDNVSSNTTAMDVTLERAEDTISEATELRRNFLAKALKTIGVLETEHPPASGAATIIDRHRATAARE